MFHFCHDARVSREETHKLPFTLDDLVFFAESTLRNSLFGKSCINWP